MVAIKLQNFGGMKPAVDPRLLPQDGASDAENAWLYTGAIAPLREAVPVYTPQSVFTKRVFRVPEGTYYDKSHIEGSKWMEFATADVDVIHSPTVGDSFERFYWAGAQDGGPMPPSYNTKERILADDPPYILGVPAPTVKPGVTATTGSGGIAEARAYVYTWLTEFGEESAPSPPGSATGTTDGTWHLTMTAPPASVTDGRSITRTRIYRTVTATGGATTYFFVDEIDIALLVYDDTFQNDVITTHAILQTLYWTPPPADIIGIVLLPNGIIAGWRDNEVWFCEPYRPHAWPVSYVLPVEYPIIGLGVIGQSLIVCTTGNPYTVSGINPASMSLARISSYEPCLSRGSILSGPNGVAYASSNGVVMAVPGQVTLATQGIINRDQWLDFINYLNVPSLRAVRLASGYYCWGSIRPGAFNPAAFQNNAFLMKDESGADRGAFIDLMNQKAAYVKLSDELPMTSVFADRWTGEPFFMRGGVVYWLDLSALDPNIIRLDGAGNVRPLGEFTGSYVWRSKILDAPNQRNFAAMRVWFSDYEAIDPLEGPMSTGIWDDREYWVDSRPVVINGVASSLPYLWIDSSTDALRTDQHGIVRVYADGREVFARQLLTSGEIFKLPAGFKATSWEIEIEGRASIKTIEFATTAKELQTV